MCNCITHRLYKDFDPSYLLMIEVLNLLSIRRTGKASHTLADEHTTRFKFACDDIK